MSHIALVIVGLAVGAAAVGFAGDWATGAAGSAAAPAAVAGSPSPPRRADRRRPSETAGSSCARRWVRTLVSTSKTAAAVASGAGPVTAGCSEASAGAATGRACCN